MSAHVRVRPSRSRPGEISLAILDADGEVLATICLRPDNARRIAQALLKEAEALEPAQPAEPRRPQAPRQRPPARSGSPR
jgi:hypothetical protein